MSKKKRHKPHEEHVGEAWLLPYSDLMTLLLALFIALFAMSQTDQTKMQQMAQAFSSAFNMGGPSFFDKAGPNVSPAANVPSGKDEDQGNAAYIQENKELEQIQEELNQYIEQNNLGEVLETQMTEDGLMLRIKERALFDSGSATVAGQANNIAPVIAQVLTDVPKQRVVISGHTDNVPINTAQFPSNWELSSSRAMNFMKYLFAQKSELDPTRFSAIGYSEYRPVAPNDTEAGRVQNRRVEILIARNARYNPYEPQGKNGGGGSDSQLDKLETIMP